MGGHEGSDGGHRPGILVGMGCRHRDGSCPKAPRIRHMLAVHDAVTTESQKIQHSLGKLVPNRRAHSFSGPAVGDSTPTRTGCTAGGGRRLEKSSPRIATGIYKGQEPPHTFGCGQRTRFMEYLRHSSQVLAGASSGLGITWRWGCPCCDAGGLDTRHVHICRSDQERR